MITGNLNDGFKTYIKINSDGLNAGKNLLEVGSPYEPYDHFNVLSIPSSDLKLSIDGSIDWRTFNRYDVDVEVVDQNNGSKEKVKSSCSKFNNDIMPDKVIYNGDTTILISDDDKYVVKCTEGDKFDPVFGFLYGYFLMNNGMSKTQAAKFFKHLEKCAFEIPEVKKSEVKVDKVEDIISDKSLTLDDYEKMMREVLENFIV